MLEDVLARFVSVERARDVYGVVLERGDEAGQVAVDEKATMARRAQVRAQGGSR